MKHLSLVMLVCILCVCSFLNSTGCATSNGIKSPTSSFEGAETQETSNRLTHGQVQLTLKKGVTTQSEVLEVFGAPNITTIDSSGLEVWTYQKHAIVEKSKSSNMYGTIILFGAGSKAAGFEQSARTMTLIIKFDENKKVVDFKSMSTSF
jgi:outer membrane protein assembly factor BamE (lipoprotein component of BamABCDE complex)